MNVNEDYSHVEVENCVNELLNVHKSKLMVWEISALESLFVKNKNTELHSTERDWLMGIHDRIAEAGY